MYRKTFLLLAVLTLARGNVSLSGKSAIDGRIIGGEEAKIEDFPHQVTVLLDGAHYCGGSIIKSDVILTAAQCVIGRNFAYTIQYGASNVNDGKTVVVKRIIAHPDFNISTFDYDVALLFLEEKIQFGANAKPVTVASKALVAGTSVVVTGWGITNPNNINSSPNVLQKVHVNIVDRAACKAQFSDGLTDRMFCAGVDEGDKDACNGDIGGPMISDNVLVGIVSWNYYCARPKYASIYSNVTELLPWIVENAGIANKIAFL